MCRRFVRLKKQTGASGERSELDDLVLRVMRKEKDLSGDTIGSSALQNPIHVLGKNNYINCLHCIKQYAVCLMFLTNKYISLLTFQIQKKQDKFPRLLI